MLVVLQIGAIFQLPQMAPMLRLIICSAASDTHRHKKSPVVNWGFYVSRISLFCWYILMRVIVAVMLIRMVPAMMMMLLMHRHHMMSDIIELFTLLWGQASLQLTSRIGKGSEPFSMFSC